MSSIFSRKSIYACIIGTFFVTVSVSTQAYTLQSQPVETGDKITKTLWNKLVSDLVGIKGSISNSESGSSVWDEATGGINFSAGKVGIGTTTPSAKLEVNGSANVIGDLTSQSSLKVRNFILLDNDGDFTGSNYYTISDDVDGDFLRMGRNFRDDLIISSNGNVGIDTATPGAKLEVAGDIIRTIAHKAGNGPIDSRDNGQIISRVLNFTKKKSSTKIRIGYTDSLRVNSSGVGKACRWEIKINGASCSQPLVYDYYTNSSNTHRSRNVVGYCSGVTTGLKQIQVWVSNVPGYTGSDCHTGWLNSTWVLEAEEVN